MLVSKMKNNTIGDDSEVSPLTFFIRTDFMTATIPPSKLNGYYSWVQLAIAEMGNTEMYGTFMMPHHQAAMMGLPRRLSTKSVGFSVPRQGLRMDPSGSILTAKLTVMPGIIPILGYGSGASGVAYTDIAAIVEHSPAAHLEFHLQDEAGNYCTPSSVYGRGKDLDGTYRLVGVDIIFPGGVMYPQEVRQLMPYSNPSVGGQTIYQTPVGYHPTAMWGGCNPTNPGSVPNGHYAPPPSPNGRGYQYGYGYGTPNQCPEQDHTTNQQDGRFGGTVWAAQHPVPPNYQNPTTHPTEPRVGDVVVPAEQNLRSRGAPEGADDKATGPADPTIDQPKE